MTTKDMLQVLIKGQDELQKRLGVLEKGHDALQIGQTSLKEELAVLRKEMKDGFEETRKGFEETRKGFREVHERLDKQGKYLAYLEDDAPTRKEHDALVKRVEKVEKVLS